MAMKYFCSSTNCPVLDAVKQKRVPVGMCPTVEKATNALLKYFKHSTFRPGQLESIVSFLHGSDVFVRMATGAGKSLCMYLGPLTVSDSACAVVISPLISLMEQQVAQLEAIGVSTIRVDSTVDVTSVCQGKYRFVFISPENAVKPPWREVFKTPSFLDKLCLIAIDEAHCVEEWGKDFRKSFSLIGGLRALTTVPFLALTASATPAMQEVITSSLNLRNPMIISQDLDLPNIFLSVSKSSTIKRDLDGISSLLRTGVGIPKSLIFCQTKDMAINVYRQLLDSSKHKTLVGLYHASLTQGTKSFFQSQFSSPCANLRVLVSTVAFGMGMDVGDIELVVVYGIPQTIANVNQLIGRAGRNGRSARAHIFYKNTKKMRNMDDQNVVKLCINQENCKRNILIGGVGGKKSSALTHDLCCDVCSNGQVPYDRLDVLKPVSISRKRKSVAVRYVSDDMRKNLRQRLIQERKSIADENPGFKAMGLDFIYSNNVIDSICDQSTYIDSIEVMERIPSLRPEYATRVYESFMDIVGSAPPPKRNCRTKKRM